MKLYINFLSSITKLSDYISLKGWNSACLIQTFKLLRDEGEHNKPFKIMYCMYIQQFS